MKKKIAVTYSVKYVKEVELEINEENLEDLQTIGAIKYETDSNSYEDIFTYNQDVLYELPIPNVILDGNRLNTQIVEYVDGSSYIESFELANK